MPARIAPAASTFGLPESLHIPIAASDLAAIRAFVGTIVAEKKGRDGTPQALLVRPTDRSKKLETDVPLWAATRRPELRADRGFPAAAEAMSRLHPAKQCWVHVNYSGYRRAYFEFGLVAPAGYFLDHVQNRKAIRQRHLSHPWLRLCPVARAVNTSGGSIAGGEGMEKAFLKGLAAPLSSGPRIIYADPMDLTKMLDLEPGTGNLDGVRLAQQLFYPK